MNPTPAKQKWQCRKLPFGPNPWYCHHPNGITLYAATWQRAWERGEEYAKDSAPAPKETQAT